MRLLLWERAQAKYGTPALSSKRKIQNISRRRPRLCSPNDELGHFMLYTATVLLIKSFVWWGSRCRCRGDFLQLIPL